MTVTHFFSNRSLNENLTVDVYFMKSFTMINIRVLYDKKLRQLFIHINKVLYIAILKKIVI